MSLNENVLKLSGETWEKDVLQSKTPVLVDFWAEWCAPCRAIGPTIEGLAQEFAGRLAVGKLNVDDHPEVGARYGVRSIPTLLIFKDGQVVEQRIGALPKAELTRLLESHAPAATASAS
jgi:thioredoxin 1